MVAVPALALEQVVAVLVIGAAPGVADDEHAVPARGVRALGAGLERGRHLVAYPEVDPEGVIFPEVPAVAAAIRGGAAGVAGLVGDGEALRRGEPADGLGVLAALAGVARPHAAEDPAATAAAGATCARRGAAAACVAAPAACAPAHPSAGAALPCRAALPSGAPSVATAAAHSAPCAPGGSSSAGPARAALPGSSCRRAAAACCRAPLSCAGLPRAPACACGPRAGAALPGGPCPPLRSGAAARAALPGSSVAALPGGSIPCGPACAAVLSVAARPGAAVPALAATLGASARAGPGEGLVVVDVGRERAGGQKPQGNSEGGPGQHSNDEGTTPRSRTFKPKV